VQLVHTRNRAYIQADGVITDRDTVNNDYLVFGSWERSTAARPGPQSMPQINYFRYGTIDRNDVTTYGIGDARYEGRALGHYNHDGDSWEEWVGKVHLEANFAPEERNIEGEIIIPTSGYGSIPDGHNLDTIRLQVADIDGSVNADARINGIAAGTGSGTWQADFYGTAINNAPNGVTGQFSTERSAVTGDNPQTAAEIQGVFGAQNVGQLRN